jgi:methyltransferase (TIGR00027 family)
VRNPDYLAERLLGPEVRAVPVDHPVVHALDQTYDEAIKNPEVVWTVSMMMVRTRFIDDRLEQAIRDGATQVVVLGAGFDSRAYRFAGLLGSTPVFEVDRPVIQDLKKRRIGEILSVAPVNVTYVPIDFRHESLAARLYSAGFASGRRTFFICEGVTMYIPEQAVRETLRFVAEQAPGSSIVFDYVYAGAIEFLKTINPAYLPEPIRPALQRMLSLESGEPWIFGMPSENEAGFLNSVGLEVVQKFAISGEEAIQRYLTRSDGTAVFASPRGQYASPAANRSMYFLLEARRS